MLICLHYDQLETKKAQESYLSSLKIHIHHLHEKQGLTVKENDYKQLMHSKELDSHDELASKCFEKIV